MKASEINYSEIPSPLRVWLDSQGFSPDCKISLAGSAGSGRTYYRLSFQGKTFVLLVSPASDVDFSRFLRLTQFYQSLTYPVPRIYCIHDESMQVLLEDLGDVTLYKKFHEDPQIVATHYIEVVKNLVDLQTRVFSHYKESPDIANRKFDKPMYLWETNYFQEYFLESYRKQSFPENLKGKLSTEFNKLAELVSQHPLTIVHRDFQSQNIMLQGNAVKIIDYQGSRLGSPYYDLASLLLDPYVNLPPDTIEKLFREYHTCRDAKLKFDESFTNFLQAGAQRLFQALGAYCNLAYHKNLGQFEKYIEPAMEKLCWTMKTAEMKKLYNLLKPFL